ncbi:MAG TPA: MFS transporter, partial [Candidatus Diapherotrites archaeon]|nr:MFS transporter [Candidatus Diapherotrites archaeon]
MKAYKHINLVMFFSALLFSAFGYEFIFFIMTLHIYDLSKNALNVGIFTALTFIPRLFSSLMGGLADKLRKRKCLMFSAVMISILLLLMSYTADIRLIYTVWFIASIFLTFIVNVRGALMAEIVSQEKYTSGNAMVLSLLNAAKLLGPLLGGFIVSLYHTKP